MFTLFAPALLHQANGEEAPAYQDPDIDVEAEVATAMDAVPKPKPAEATDGDILSALLDKGVVTKDAIVHALALHHLGDKAYTKHPDFAA